MTQRFKLYPILLSLSLLGMLFLIAQPALGGTSPNISHQAQKLHETSKPSSKRQKIAWKKKKFHRAIDAKKALLVALVIFGTTIIGGFITVLAFFSTLGLGILGGVAIFTAGWFFLVWAAIKLVRRILRPKAKTPKELPNLSPR